MKSLCIYHANCADGFTAAWVVRKAFGEDNVEFYPGFYQTPAPDVSDRDVFLVDFSYKRPVLEKMKDQANTITILDHHKTAEADLKDLKGIKSIFDMNRSGARITWDYFFTNENPPELLLHIEDRDLWRFALRKTREIQASVFAYPYDFKAWDYLMKADMEKLSLEGEAIERKHFKDIRELIKVVTRRMNICGYNVPVANLPYIHSSDAGHILGENEPFAACYWDTPTGRVFSLRSSETGVDVSDIAKQFGGGGHKHASGFEISYEEAKKFEI
jgi:oligoribonuclease NrnB/cAMP/cGMP phosphodiesterase (DHH superfamily)